MFIKEHDRWGWWSNSLLSWDTAYYYLYWIFLTKVIVYFNVFFILTYDLNKLLVACLIPNLLKCFTNIIRYIVSNAFDKFKSTITHSFSSKGIKTIAWYCCNICNLFYAFTQSRVHDGTLLFSRQLASFILMIFAIYLTILNIFEIEP